MGHVVLFNSEAKALASNRRFPNAILVIVRDDGGAFPGNPAKRHPSNSSGRGCRHHRCSRGVGGAVVVAFPHGADVAGIDICATVDPRSGVTPSSREDLDHTGKLVEAAGGRWISFVADPAGPVRRCAISHQKYNTSSAASTYSLPTPASRHFARFWRWRIPTGIFN